jgi:hypothetical protein
LEFYPSFPAISLYVVNELKEIKTRMMGCIGFGAERDLSYGQVLGNISTLIKAGGYLGSCSLTSQMQAYLNVEHHIIGRKNTHTFRL